MGRTSVATDDFAAYTAGVFMSSNWTNLNGFSGELRVTPGGGAVDTAYGSPSMARRSAGTYSADQYAKVQILGISGTASNDRYGIALRATADGAPGDDGYVVYLDDVSPNKTFRIGRINNGTLTVLSSNTSESWSSGDTVEGEVTGTGATVTITAYRNGVSVFSYDDTDANRLTSAERPGLFGSLSGGGLSMDNWEGGDVTADSNALTGPLLYQRTSPLIRL